MDALSVTQKIYRRLRRPSDAALPYPDILDAVSEVIAKKKVDLNIYSNDDSGNTTTGWITANGREVSLSNANILIPLKVERENCDVCRCGYQTDVPIVDYDVLDRALGAVAFYGSPLKMALNSYGCYGHRYRITYQSDFTDQAEIDGSLDLPSYFAGMVADEATYQLIDQVDDQTEAWMNFVKVQNLKLPVLIAEWEEKWLKFCRHRRGKTTIKTTFWDNRRRNTGRRLRGF